MATAQNRPTDHISNDAEEGRIARRAALEGILVGGGLAGVFGVAVACAQVLVRAPDMVAGVGVAFGAIIAAEVGVARARIVAAGRAPTAPVQPEPMPPAPSPGRFMQPRGQFGARAPAWRDRPPRSEEGDGVTALVVRSPAFTASSTTARPEDDWAPRGLAMTPAVELEAAGDEALLRMTSSAPPHDDPGAADWCVTSRADAAAGESRAAADLEERARTEGGVGAAPVPMTGAPPGGVEIWRRMAVYTVRADGPDLSTRQIALLLAVYASSAPKSVGELAEDLGVAKPVISRAVDTLAGLGLLERRRDADDRRKVYVEPTAAGAAYVEAQAEGFAALQRADDGVGAAARSRAAGDAPGPVAVA